MKCPKCGYLGFKHVERCPNCGYDFSLSSAPALPDLAIRPSALDTPQPLADLALVDARMTLAKSEAAPGPTPELGWVKNGATPAPSAELPLFGSPIADDVPLITKASPPRTPLAVRRSTPEVPRLRSEIRTPMLDLGSPDADSRPTPLTPPARRVAVPLEPRLEEGPQSVPPAGVAARIAAAAIDLLLLAAIDVGVVYFTMQITGVTASELAILPKIPLLSFLTAQNIAYFVLFTAGGQTMGQMALGIKVISDSEGVPPDVSHAIVRTFVWTLLTAPVGLGLATALFSDDRRGLHDRWSGTRVVRANA